MKKYLAISDIHGMLDAFNELLDKCYNPDEHQLILLGDYADRGPDSKGVIARVRDLVETDHAIALMGNHDEWFMACADDENGYKDELWHHNGGLQTIASYGRNPAQLIEDAKWLKQNLPLYHVTHDYIFVHAGVAPMIPLEKQRQQDLVWGRYNGVCGLGKLVVHGHTPMENVTQIHDQLFIDTGAVFGNKLSAVLFPEMQVFEVSTKGNSIHYSKGKGRER